jgi:YjbE family integral membrane protein
LSLAGPELVAAILNIVIIDLVLSGDNAVVIGMAASRLAGKDRRTAIVWGVVGAIGLRVTFTAMFAMLLGVPLLQLGGGLLLVWIAYKLVRPPSAAEHGSIKAASNRWEAIRTIVMADVVMSLDNILAVGGAAHGELWLLLFGLALSMPLITFGSGFVAWALDRASWLMFVGGAVLAKVAGEMISHDPYTKSLAAGVPALAQSVTLPLFGTMTMLEVALELGIVIVVVAAGLITRAVMKGEPTLREQAHEGAEAAEDVSEEMIAALRERGRRDREGATPSEPG